MRPWSPAGGGTVIRPSGRGRRVPWQLAQFNLARARWPLEAPEMDGFRARIEETNALADAAPGFVWRLQGDGGDATYLRPYDDRTLVNLSVWTDVEALRAFTYDSAHRGVMALRRDWFEPGSTRLVLWWVPRGHRPTLEEADDRLRRLGEGDGPGAFTFRSPFAPPTTP